MTDRTQTGTCADCGKDRALCPHIVKCRAEFAAPEQAAIDLFAELAAETRTDAAREIGI
jgi:hypothetical protein